MLPGRGLRESPMSSLVIDPTTTDYIIESQFLPPLQVDDLRNMTRFVPVTCYGLRTDYRSRLFPGAKRLMEVTDVIEEIRTECFFCRNKATMNMKFEHCMLVTEAGDTFSSCHRNHPWRNHAVCLCLECRPRRVSLLERSLGANCCQRQTRIVCTRGQYIHTHPVFGAVGDGQFV